MGFNYRIYLTAMTSCVGGLLFGYDTGFIGSATQIHSFQRDFGMNSGNMANVKGNIVATLQAGCFFGTIFMAFFTAKFGRRWGMALASLIFNIGAILQVVTTGHLGLLYAGRAISGFGVGGASMLTPIYLSEVAPRNLRGRLGTAYGFSIFFGIMVSYWVDYGCEQGLSEAGHLQWRVPMGLQLVPGALLFVGAIFIRESPRWLIKVGRRDKGLDNLCYIRMAHAEDAELQQEFQDICFNTDEEAKLSHGVTIKEILAPQYRMRVLIGFTVMVAQQFSGTNALTYYAPLLFNTLGLTGTSSSLFATGVYGIVKTVFSMLFLLFLAERAGRRLPLFIGALAMSATMLVVGFTLVAKPPAAGADSPSSSSVAMIVMIYLFCVSYSMSWGPIPFTYVSEIYPNRIREYCVAMGLATQWAFNYCISRIVPLAIQNIGWRTFLMFGIFNLVIAVFVFLVLRETSGVALEHMDQVFSTGFFMPRNQWHLTRPIAVNHDATIELERQLSAAKADAEDHLEDVSYNKK
ncbi:general substrate transporter [Lipomyces japonicus]|uniref:general substrate transporter n=1 Tax=Lipomyces japonicus TaxID=56871 RepID=UPI0034CE0103